MVTDFLKLGDLVLTNSQVKTFSDNSGYKYASHELISGKPVLQATGPTLGTITISVTLVSGLYHNIKKIKKSIDSMKESGEPYKLVFANGVYQGEYVIESVSGSVEKTTFSGNIILLTLSIVLKEWTRRTLVTEERHTQEAEVKREIIEK